MCEHGSKTTLVFLPADGEASWSLLPSLVSLLSGGTVQPENTYSHIIKVTGQVWESHKKRITSDNYFADLLYPSNSSIFPDVFSFRLFWLVIWKSFKVFKLSTISKQFIQFFPFKQHSIIIGRMRYPSTRSVAHSNFQGQGTQRSLPFPKAGHASPDLLY